METNDDDNNLKHQISTPAVDIENVEDNKIPQDQSSVTHASKRTAKAKKRSDRPSTWVCRSTRNVKKEPTHKKPTPEDELEAILAEPPAKESANVTQKDQAKRKRPKKVESRKVLTPEDERETLSEQPTSRKAPKIPKSRKSDKAASVKGGAGSLTPFLGIAQRTEAEDFEQAKELERQRQLMFLAMLERQNGYVRSDLTEPESAMRSSLDRDVSNDGFTAALILREMANQDPAYDPLSKAFIQRLKNALAPEGTEESNNPIKKEESPKAPTLRRSGRKKTLVSIDKEHSSSPTAQAEPPTPGPLKLNENEGFMPSAANSFKFKYDSPSGLRAEELDAILKPPSLPKSFPADLANEKVSIAKSYKFLGAKPKANASGRMIEQVELEMQQRQEEVEMVMAEEDRWNEL